MNENLTSNPLADYVSASDVTVLNGQDVLSDPGLAQLRRYLPVLAVVAAPYANLGGDYDPMHPIDREAEWRLLVEILAGVHQRSLESSAPLAFVRLMPPTGVRLGQVLAHDGPDGFPVVHLVCHGERDMLYLEDDTGHEAYIVTDRVVKLFAGSRARLVVMDGCFSEAMAKALFEGTGVQAVVGTRRKVAEASMVAFATRLYAELAAGAGVQTAFRAAIQDVNALPDGQPDRFDCLTVDDHYEIPLPLPAPDSQAARPLVCDGLPRTVGLPATPGFVGRRETLTMMATDLAAQRYRLCIVHGPLGAGKSWLVAEAVNRFGWHFPDGIAWFPVNQQTTAREIIAALSMLAGGAPHDPPDTVLARVKAQRVLLVLDRVDYLGSGAEMEQLATFIQRFDPAAGSLVMATAREVPPLLAKIEASVRTDLGALSPKAARTLAMRLAVERGLEELDVDTIDDFLEHSRHLPWLIVKGINLVESDGLSYALEDLAAYRPELKDALELYLGRRIKLLALEPDEPLRLIIRAQAMPDIFEAALVPVVAGGAARQHIGMLAKHSLVEQHGGWLWIPARVRAYCRDYYPLAAAELQQIDRLVLAYYAENWPEQPAGEPLVLDRALRARLNTVRASLRRQLEASAVDDPATVAQMLILSAAAFRAAGLADEFLRYAQAIRELLAEGRAFARLQVAMGEALTVLPNREDDASWMFQIGATLANLDPNTLGETNVAYGRHLLARGEYDTAAKILNAAFQALVGNPSADVTMAATLAHEWARALSALRRYPEAAKRFQAALAGYAQVRRADLSIEAQRDLSAMLIAAGELDQADDALRRALATADHLGMRHAGGHTHAELARLHLIYADHAQREDMPDDTRLELEQAAAHFSQALADLLPVAATPVLAGMYLQLAQVQARLGTVEDASANGMRAWRLYDRAGDPLDVARTALVVGRLRMVQGDSVGAQSALHTALELALRVGDRKLAWQAASVLVRVHQIRARHAQAAGGAFHRNTLDQASFSHAALLDAGLAEHAAALETVMHSLMNQAGPARS